MFEISELVDCIQKYGNCKVYFYDNCFPNENDTIIFYCNDGKINMIEQVETYEEMPRWDGQSFHPVEPISVRDEKRNPFLYNLAFVIYSTFSVEKVAITCEKNNEGKSFDNEARIITEFILRMIGNFKKQEYGELYVEFMPDYLLKLASKRKKMKLESDGKNFKDQVDALMNNFIGNSNGSTNFIYRLSLFWKQQEEKATIPRSRKRILYIPKDDDDDD